MTPGNTFFKSMVVSVVLGKINWLFKNNHKVQNKADKLFQVQKGLLLFGAMEFSLFFPGSLSRGSPVTLNSQWDHEGFKNIQNSLLTFKNWECSQKTRFQASLKHRKIWKHGLLIPLRHQLAALFILRIVLNVLVKQIIFKPFLLLKNVKHTKM